MAEHWKGEELEKQKQLAERLESYCFVYCGVLYVMDHGAEAIKDPINWTPCFGCSVRDATDEEQELWRVLSKEAK